MFRAHSIIRPLKSSISKRQRPRGCQNTYMGTHRTNICCAIVTLLPFFSNITPTPPATAPATIAYHRRVFFRTQISCACARKDRRPRLRSEAVGAIVTGISSSSYGVTGEEKGEICDRRGCGGRRMGNALRINLYNAENEPILSH